MGIAEIILIAFGLSADAFAVSVTDGLSIGRMKLLPSLALASVFGIFQGIMPLLGFFAGQSCSRYIVGFDHIIAFVLLGWIGGKMIVSSLRKKNEAMSVWRLSPSVIIAQGVATSIDALAVGVSFSALSLNIAGCASVIAGITFACNLAGIYIGKKFGNILNKKAEFIGGLILVSIGVKIFIEHTFFQ